MLLKTLLYEKQATCQPSPKILADIPGLRGIWTVTQFNSVLCSAKSIFLNYFLKELGSVCFSPQKNTIQTVKCNKFKGHTFMVRGCISVLGQAHLHFFSARITECVAGLECKGGYLLTNKLQLQRNNMKRMFAVVLDRLMRSFRSHYDECRWHCDLWWEQGAVHLQQVAELKIQDFLWVWQGWTGWRTIRTFLWTHQRNIYSTSWRQREDRLSMSRPEMVWTWKQEGQWTRL